MNPALLEGYERACPGSAVEIIFRAYGKARTATVTYLGPDGTSQVDIDPTTTWEHTECFELTDRAPTMSIQNGSTYGDVGCSITADRRTIASNRSSGDYAIADCSA